MGLPWLPMACMLKPCWKLNMPFCGREGGNIE
jgi:hypothetical protein